MTPRLFVTADLAEGHVLTLEAAPSHYLANVLRLAPGAPVLLFNGRDGEWAASLMRVSKKAVDVQLDAQTRPQDAVPDITLMFAPIKGDRVDSIAEKATELGVARMQPVITARTVVRRVNEDRLRARAVEAAEQTGRLSVPTIDPAAVLEAVLASWNERRLLIFADEAGDGEAGFWGGDEGRARPMLEALGALSPRPDKLALLVGPEGGFSPEERRRLRGLRFVLPVTLGPRILRADTAVFAGLTLLQAALGDWAA